MISSQRVKTGAAPTRGIEIIKYAKESVEPTDEVEPIDETDFTFDPELWEIITSQESEADPLPAEIEPPDGSNPLWVEQLGNSALERPRGVAVDANGNVYMAGGTLGSLDGYVNASGNNSNQSDPFLTKYDASGNKVWTRQVGSVDWDFYTDVTVDDTGSIYTVGEDSYGTVNKGVSLTKWDSSGNRSWSRSLDSSAYDWSSGITHDRFGNVYLAGLTYGALGGLNSGQSDAFVAKYDRNGNKVWTRQLGTTSHDVARSVATDTFGNVYLAGITEGGLDGNLNSGSSDIFLTKYNSSGSKLWTRQFGSSASDGSVSEYERNLDLSIDSSGNVYISGTTEGSLHGNTHAGGKDAFVTKYNSNGLRLWTRQLGTAGEDRSMGVDVDSEGKVYISGWTTGALDGKTNSGSTDAFVTKYDRFGNKIVTALLGTAAADASRDVVTDSAGNVYISGWTDGSLARAAGGSHDAFVAKYQTLQPNQAPIVSASDQSVNINQTFKPTFSVSDPDGDTITRYWFNDNTSSSTSGYFERFINGQWVKQGNSFGGLRQRSQQRPLPGQ
jgi:hypothetical protein